MIAYNKWSFSPYRPFLTFVGDIYVCRVCPSENAVRFEWLPIGESKYSVFFKKRSETDFNFYCDTKECFCDIVSLESDTDYEFFVASESKKSRVRIARTGKSVGITVNYLHPNDEAYSFSGRYLCSPSLLRHPDGYLLASMDVYASQHPQNLTLIFRSDDDGKSWHYVSELMPCFWGKMFIFKGELYMLSVSTEYGDLLIGKSMDGGKTFSSPVALLRGSGGKNGNSGVHKNPQNLVFHNGRLYCTLEWGTWKNKEYGHAAMIMSCDENSDITLPESWSFSEPLPFDIFSSELEGLPKNTMTIEGTPVIDPDGRLLNIMRFGMHQKAIAYLVSEENGTPKLSYLRLIDFPANFSKFMIKYDNVSGYSYSVATEAYDPENPKARNLLSLLRSKDLLHFEVVCNLLDYRHESEKLVGFQYVDFEFENEDIIYLCRTAINGAHSYHDSNYSTFHRIKDFRKL